MTNDKRKFLFFSTIVVALSLGFYLITNTINTIVASSQIFVSAFAQQALPAILKTDDSFTNTNTNNNTLTSSSISDKPAEEDLIKLYDIVDQSVVQVTQNSNIPVSQAWFGFRI